MKKIISIILVLTFVILYVTSTFVIAKSDEIAENIKTYEPTTISNNYNKLHFYFDNVEHNVIDNLNELEDAINDLEEKNALSKTINSNSVDSEEIKITLQFSSDFTQTEKYRELLNERETLKTSEEILDFRKRLNEYSKDYHKKLIKKNMEDIKDLEYSSVDAVDYSPFVIVKTSVENIKTVDMQRLMDLDCIEHISMGYEAVPCATGVSSWNDCLNVTGAYQIVGNGSYTGEGIRIGILESDGVADPIHPSILGKNYTIRGAQYIDDHATAVTTILAEMVPDATFFCSTIVNNEVGVQWFIDNYCDIINCSFSYRSAVSNVDGTYEFVYHGYREDYDAVFDYQVYTHLITVVVAAGNKVEDNTKQLYNPEGYVMSPGLAYNAITVGGVWENSASEWVHEPNASYKVQFADASKPTVSAPSYVSIPNIDISWRGTSFSAPQVTACIAMLMEEDSTYMLHPEKVHALITATATKTSDYSGITTGFDNKVGAGIVNIERMLSLTTDLHYINTNPFNEREVFSVDLVLDQTYEFGASLSWLSYVYGTIDEETSDRLYERHNTNYDLLIYDSSDTLVHYSTLTHSAVELVRFIVPRTDDYRIVIYQTSTMWALNYEDHIALSYYVDYD